MTKFKKLQLRALNIGYELFKTNYRIKYLLVIDITKDDQIIIGSDTIYCNNLKDVEHNIKMIELEGLK